MVLIGHSNIDCVVEAAGARGLDLRHVNLWHDYPVVHDEAGRRLAPAIEDALDGPVFSYVGGGEPHVLGLVAHPRPFDFVLPEAPELPVSEDAEILPAAVVRSILVSLAEETFEVLRMMRARAPGPIRHMENPPIIRDERPIDHPAWVARVGPSKVVSPPAFRRKLWLMHTRLVADFCAAEGIDYLRHPEGVTDPDGYLLPQYVGRPCHANAAYGALVLDQMRAAA